MSLSQLQPHYGFTRMPFGKALAPQMLCLLYTSDAADE